MILHRNVTLKDGYSSQTHSSLSLSTCYDTKDKQENNSLADLLSGSLDQPDHVVTWNLCQMLSHQVPISTVLEIIRRMPITQNVSPVLRRLPVEHISTPQRITLLHILLQRGLIPEAAVQIDLFFEQSSQNMEDYLPQLADIWKAIVRKYFTCPRLMCKWLDRMPETWAIPTEVATKLIISPLVAPISLAYKVINLYSKSNTAQSPAPYHAFFLVAKNTLKGKLLEAGADDNLDLPQTSLIRGSPVRGVLHWRCIWTIFQTMNRKIPTWTSMLTTDQVQNLSLAVLETMLVRAPPVMCLYTARKFIKEGVLSESYCAVLLLKRLPENIVGRSIPVMRRIYLWLVKSYPFHTGLLFDVFTVGNSLIRADLFDCVADLYDGIFQGIHFYSADQKRRIIDTFKDIVCPECANILNSGDVHSSRTCTNCFAVIEEKGKDEIASFLPRPDVIEVSKLKNRESFKESIRELRSRPDFSGAQFTGADPLARLRREVLEEPVLMSKVSLGTREIELSLPADQLEIKDVEALRKVASQKQEIDARCLALQSSSFDLSIQAAHLQKAELPSTTSLKPLIARLGLFTPSKDHSLLTQDETKPDALTTQQTKQSHPLYVPSSVPSWDCIWCGETNTKENGVVCDTCGAETGPDTVWRTYLFCPSRKDSKSDHRKPTNLEELDYRLENIGKKSREEVVSAAYWAMLYQKKFLLTADETGVRQLNALTAALCNYKERVMAAYVYFRMIPPAYRERSCLLPLMKLFGTHSQFDKLSSMHLANISISRVVGKTTCTTCFDLCHTWKECPLITRRVIQKLKSGDCVAKPEPSRMHKPTLSSTERAEMEGQALQTSIRGVKDFHSAKSAFTLFLGLSDPLLFCAENPGMANRLVRSLLEYGHRKRGAYVLNHIERHQRENAAYEALSKWYGVSHNEIASLLSNRRIGDASSPHPYFAQVIGVCCVCMDESHAAHMCPIFAHWMQKETKASKSGQIQYRFRGLTAGQSQAKSFCFSGPERLDAFFKYLLNISRTLNKSLAGSAVQYGVNRCVQALLTRGMEVEATKLLLRIPQSLLEVETVKYFTEKTGQRLHVTDFESDRLIPVDSVLPRATCWLCFEPSHVLSMCPKHAHKKTDARLADTVAECMSTGQAELIAAAADYLLGFYMRGKYQLLFSSRAFSAIIEELMNHCVQHGFVQRAGRLFSILSLCTKKTIQAVWEPVGMQKSDLAKLMPGTPRTEVIKIVQKLGACPFCMTTGDHTAKCPTLQDDHDFGRNILAMFRSEILLNGGNEFTTGSLNVMHRLKRTLVAHADHLPYHIPQVRIAMNAMACHFFLDKEFFHGMELLQAIPMQFRKPLLYHRCLQAYGLSNPRVLHDIRARLTPRVDCDELLFTEPLQDELFVLKDQKQLCHCCWRLGHHADNCSEDKKRLVRISPAQMFDFDFLKREVDVIQTEMEDFYDVKLGVRHPLFSDENMLKM
ncbi:phage-like element pbsx protein xkdT [Perkinsela sp. CCAP 1560/4]|nr:phage-like element pbsx protein xkdT [Perkinsela sp. CCAP 1560/4]|eukprot:KNH07782.1 phage-like element pbsx protein xkdT [Perkinsela sp. CCAP 1560/4]